VDGTNPAKAPPDHLHLEHDEVFFILEGTYELTVGGQTSTARPGTIVFLPKRRAPRCPEASPAIPNAEDWPTRASTRLTTA